MISASFSRGSRFAAPVSAWLVAGVLFVPPAGAQTPAPFLQDSMADGIVSIEAENFHANLARNGVAWTVLANNNAAGGFALQALPNNGLSLDTNFTATSPRLDYQVQFNRSGIHYAWVRGYGPASPDNSLHLGLNGGFVDTADRAGPYSSSGFTWEKDDSGTALLTLNIPSAGVHTVNVFMREDGTWVDKIVLTSNPNFAATGFGPPESVRVGQVTTPPDTTYHTRLRNLSVSNQVVFGQFDPLPAIETYSLVRAAAPGLPWQEAPGGLVNGAAIALPLDSASGVFALKADKVDANRELACLAMNRLAYGPTPDLLDRVLFGPSPIGAEAWIDEQLAPESLAEGADADAQIVAIRQKLDDNKATLADLRAWHSLRAIRADRQLLEVLLQFVRNHFTTETSTSQEYFQQAGLSSPDDEYAAVNLEYRQLQRWRTILLDPNGTFHDLLLASLESPAMMIYLDSVLSTADAPNENYPRELLELYTFGVDNGYTQTDIERLSNAMTGYRVRLVDPALVNDPFAPPYQPAAVFSPHATDWKYRKGLTAPPAGWMQPAHVEDASWLTGATSIGYGDGDDTTVLTDMMGSSGYSSVYFRKRFQVPSVAGLGQVTLRIYIDDGFIAYLNGQEVFRYNAPGAAGTTPAHTALATASVGDWIWVDFVIQNPAQFLVDGDNVIAVHGLNASKSSSDFSFDAELLAGPPGVWAWAFDAAEHNATNKVLFSGARVHSRFGAPWAGRNYQLDLPARSGAAGINDAYEVVAHLANQPYTMEFICAKLCQALVREEFETGSFYNIAQQTDEARLVKACLDAWEAPGPDGRKGNLRQVLRVIVDSELFRGQRAAAQKVKSPFEFCVSALRALRAQAGTNVTARTDGYDLRDPIYNMGMRLFNNATPDGYPENGNEWIDTATMAERLRFVQNLCMQPGDPLKAADFGSGAVDNVVDPVALLNARLAPADRTDAGKVTDLFLRLLLPGSGRGSLGLERDECLRLLNSNDAGVPGAAPFALSVPGSADYDRRVRSLVALLLGSPHFQEQ